MKTTTFRLLTIIADEALTSVLEEILREAGTGGHTITRVEGKGRSGSRNSLWEGENVRIDVVTTQEKVDAILEYLAEHLFDKYPVIAYHSDVQVVRSGHFIVTFRMNHCLSLRSVKGLAELLRLVLTRLVPHHYNFGPVKPTIFGGAILVAGKHRSGRGCFA